MKMMKYPLLSNIFSPSDIQSFDVEKLKSLAVEIREKIIEVLSQNGGHLASNLGIVELIIALHYCFNSPIDKFIFDTSHQTYAHKLLTGRFEKFNTLRTFNGLSGFSSPEESLHDHMYSGHAGAAFSTSLGIAKSRDLEKKSFHILPIIGDASFTCGLTLEALNNIPKDLKKFIVILNDNKMFISKSVGNFKNILSRLINHPTSNKIYIDILEKISKIPSFGNLLANQGRKIKESIKNLVSPASFFENFGLNYIGPIDGHDIRKIIDTLNAIKNSENPSIIHVLTKKGSGLTEAFKNPTNYHGVSSFDINTGKFFDQKKLKKKKTFPKIFGSFLLKLAEKNQNFIAISPAMLSGSCLSEFNEKYPNRCVDVGIAEGHLASFAGGFANNKNKNIIASVYSSFLQRSFDNIFQDICLQNAPVTFAIDRAGISGPDGPSHHGIFDISFLKAMPNMIISQPRNGNVLKELLNSSFHWKCPSAIRYPNIATTEDNSMPLKSRIDAKGEILQNGEKIAIIPLGHMYLSAFEISNLLNDNYGINPSIIDPVFIKPLDKNLFKHIFETHKYIITIEEHSLIGGFGEIINSFAIKNKFNNIILNYGIKDTFVKHGKYSDVIKNIKLDHESIYLDIEEKLKLSKIVTKV